MELEFLVVGYKLPSVNAENQTWELCKSNKCSELLSCLSSLIRSNAIAGNIIYLLHSFPHSFIHSLAAIEPRPLCVVGTYSTTEWNVSFLRQGIFV